MTSLVAASNDFPLANWFIPFSNVPISTTATCHQHRKGTSRAASGPLSLAYCNQVRPPIGASGALQGHQYCHDVDQSLFDTWCALLMDRLPARQDAGDEDGIQLFPNGIGAALDFSIFLPELLEAVEKARRDLSFDDVGDKCQNGRVIAMVSIITTTN